MRAATESMDCEGTQNLEGQPVAQPLSVLKTTPEKGAGLGSGSREAAGRKELRVTRFTVRDQK